MKNRILLLLIAPLFGVYVSAQTAGGLFEPGPQMNSTRIAIQVSQDEDGNVLLFGGRSVGFVSSAYADIYDVELNTFINVNMLYPHDNAILISMSDGRFMLAGGGYDWGIPAYANIEIYDQDARTFTAGGALLYPRMQGSGVELTSGKLLIVGGWYSPDAAAYAELYDPVAGTSASAGSLVIARSSALVLPCNDGGAVVVGGYPTYGGSCFAGAEYYDPATNGFVWLADELIPEEAGFVTAMDNANKETPDLFQLPDGRYIFLAWRYDPEFEYALISFDPETKAFAKIETDVPLMGELTDGGFVDIVVNRAAGLVYLLGLNADTGGGEIGLVTVDVSTGKVYQPDEVYVCPASTYLLYGNMAYIESTGKIMYAGVSATNADYFNATTGTYWITPEFTVDVPEVAVSETFNVFPNPSNGNFRVQMDVTEPGSFTFSVTDVTGRSVYDAIYHAAVQGTFTWNVQLPALPQGYYHLLIHGNTAHYDRAIVIAE